MSSPTFVILSFEGPDPYAKAGGLGTRVSELSKALAAAGFETHLFFVGDPHLPGHESLAGGKLQLHRWCQWISQYHPAGVYDGEDIKLEDWDRSLPAWLEKELLAPKIAAGESVVIMGEEWQTTATMASIHEIVEENGWDDRVHLLWNANNTFSFDRIDWDALKDSATITTVSKYMKHLMWELKLDAEVVPNGIPENWLEPVSRKATQTLPRLFKDRLALVKVARWDPDKRWNMAVDAVAQMKSLDLKPLFLARGGLEAHGHEVWARAERNGLKVTSVGWKGSSLEVLLEAMRPALWADMVVLQGYLSETQSRALFRTANAVLANSGREPFGLVGLEAMAVGGVAMVGCTGEDYVTPGHDAIALQTDNPREIVSHLTYLDRYEGAEMHLRQEARRSAARYTWPVVIRRVLLPFLTRLGVPVEIDQPMPHVLDRVLFEGALPVSPAPATRPADIFQMHMPREARPDLAQRDGRFPATPVAS